MRGLPAACRRARRHRPARRHLRPRALRPGDHGCPAAALISVSRACGSSGGGAVDLTPGHSQARRRRHRRRLRWQIHPVERGTGRILDAHRARQGRGRGRSRRDRARGAARSRRGAGTCRATGRAAAPRMHPPAGRSPARRPPGGRGRLAHPLPVTGRSDGQKYTLPHPDRPHLQRPHLGSLTAVDHHRTQGRRPDRRGHPRPPRVGNAKDI